MHGHCLDLDQRSATSEWRPIQRGQHCKWERLARSWRQYPLNPIWLRTNYYARFRNRASKLPLPLRWDRFGRRRFLPSVQRFRPGPLVGDGVMSAIPDSRERGAGDQVEQEVTLATPPSRCRNGARHRRAPARPAGICRLQRGSRRRPQGTDCRTWPPPLDFTPSTGRYRCSCAACGRARIPMSRARADPGRVELRSYHIRRCSSRSDAPCVRTCQPIQ
jgi:hypothetical protein